MAQILPAGLELPALGVILALALLGFFLSRSRIWRYEFSPLDLAMVIAAMAIGTAAGLPILNAMTGSAQGTALAETLHAFRGQIERYRAEHNGEAPLLYRETFPQLLAPTNTQGVPGPPGPEHPYGPYFRGSLPANPITGVPTVMEVKDFPPAKPTGRGGWIYHQETGRLGVDLQAYMGM